MTDDSALIRRLEHLEAIQSIQRLSADYCHGADLRDVDLFLSVWSADPVWRVRDDLTFTGRNEIRAALEHQWKTTMRAFHWTSNASIDLSADALTARAHFDVRAESQLLDGSWIAIAGSYRDEYVVEGGEWKLSVRDAVVDSQRSA